MSVRCGISAGGRPKYARMFDLHANAPRRCVTTAVAADLTGQTDMRKGNHHSAEAMPGETKTCRACGAVKPLDAFPSTNREGKTCHHQPCRDCRNLENREWRRARASSPRPDMLPLDGLAFKVCKACGQLLSLDQFSPNPAMRDRLTSDCKSCLSDRSARRRSENLDKVFDSYLRRKYGITLERYSAMLAEQGGVCAICGEPPTVENSGKRVSRRRGRVSLPRLIVDHDHGTGKVRGLLCGLCNTGIGALKDDPAIVRFALKYLEERGE